MDRPHEGVALERQLSSLSTQRINTLREMEGRVRELEDLLHNVEHVASSTEPEGRVQAKVGLRQLVGWLDKLQFNEIDAIATSDLQSGKTSAKHYRKSLHARIEAMREHIEELYKSLETVVSFERREDEALKPSAEVELEKDPQEQPENFAVIETFEQDEANMKEDDNAVEDDCLENEYVDEVFEDDDCPENKKPHAMQAIDEPTEAPASTKMFASASLLRSRFERALGVGMQDQGRLGTMKYWRASKRGRRRP